MSQASSPTANSIPVLEGGFVCLVDGQGEYNLSKDRLEELITYVDPNKTRDYSIVGIMGCQSTGKSTLLNRLFNTKFQMMNSSTGRSQTTKGIWLDAARNTHNLVVMDLEGTDSGERGEDRTTFERQTILYGLALCEVLIVNMWEHDIGRYTASNYGVLKTVFEVNMQLFKDQGKTMLLFIIRDHVEEQTPFETLKAKLRREIEGIWAELPKPADYAAHSIDDHFDFRFEWLPHLHLQRAEFEQRCLQLRDKFIAPATDGYLLDTEYHGRKSVPAEGFAHYSQTIWDTIRSSKDLDLPTQKEMLATFRCDELASQALGQVAAALLPVREQARAAFAPTLGAQLGAASAGALALFDQGASKYVPSVVAKKRHELVAKMAEPVLEIVGDQLSRFVFKAQLAAFDAEVAAAVDAAAAEPGVAAESVFFDRTGAVRVAAVTAYAEAVAALTAGIPAEFELDLAAKQADFEGQLDARLEAQRQAAVAAIGAEALEVFNSEMQPRMTPLLRDPPADLWQRLGADFSAIFTEVAALIEPRLACLRAPVSERRAVQRALAEKAEAFVRESATQHAAILSLKLRSRFEALFLKDAAGVRRRWTVKDNVQQLFITARDEALTLIPLFARFRLREHWSATVAASALGAAPAAPTVVAAAAGEEKAAGADADDEAGSAAAAAAAGAGARRGSALSFSTIGSRLGAGSAAAPVLVSDQQQTEVEHQFKLDIEGALFDAQREQERVASATAVPKWAIAAMIFLGWNEFMALIKNPFVLVLLLLLAAAAFVVNALGMWGPVTAGLKLSAEQLYKQFQELVTPVEDAATANSATASPATAAAAAPAAAGAKPGLARRSTTGVLTPGKAGRQQYATLPAAGFKVAQTGAGAGAGVGAAFTTAAASAAAPAPAPAALDLDTLPAEAAAPASTVSSTGSRSAAASPANRYAAGGVTGGIAEEADEDEDAADAADVQVSVEAEDGLRARN